MRPALTATAPTSTELASSVGLTATGGVTVAGEAAVVTGVTAGAAPLDPPPQSLKAPRASSAIEETKEVRRGTMVLRVSAAVTSH